MTPGGGRSLSVVVSAFVACSASAQEAPAAASASRIQQVFERLRPSLVRIEVVVVDHQLGREKKQQAAGSGTIISPEGHVVTNHHVAGHARHIVCTLADREEIDAELVGTDPLSDIAVLKLRPASPRVFAPARFGDSARLAVGQPVLAMGSPFALSQSVTLGIVSNVEMTMPRLLWPFNRLELDGEDVGSLVRWIGHDAPIFGGNSGGPLVDLEGAIVGVNEISLGLAGAIPGNLAREVAEAIVRDGRVVRSWIGLEVQPLLRSSSSQRGALVAGAIAGSPAEAAGFEPGDVLLRLDGGEVQVRFAEELPLFNQAVMRLPRGRPVEAEVLRGGKRVTLRVEPVERESVEALPREIAEWGISAADLTAWSAKTLNRSSRRGARVLGVRPGGAAHEAKPPLRPDDVIVALDDEPIAGVAEVASRTAKALADGQEKRSVLVGFERGRESYLTVIELGGAALDDPGLEARKAWLPIAFQVLSPELAAALGFAGQQGVRVTHVLDPGVELRPGDVIVEVDGEPLPASQPGDAELLSERIRRLPIGSRVELTVLRDGRRASASVALGASPRLEREMRRYEAGDFDFRVRDIAPAEREPLGLGPGAGGVIVDRVAEGGWAALARLAAGDVVLAIDGRPVGDVGTLQARMAEVARARPPAVVLHVRRGIRPMFIEMLTAWSR